MIHAGLATKLVLGIGASTGVLASAASLAAESGAVSAAPWLTAGGTSISVTALAYVAKMLADGRLISRPVQDQMVAMADSLREAQRREAILADLTRDGHEREQRLWNMLPRQERR